MFIRWAGRKPFLTMNPSDLDHAIYATASCLDAIKKVLPLCDHADAMLLQPRIHNAGVILNTLTRIKSVLQDEQNFPYKAC